MTGLTGQDGSFLAELLLGHGYEVIGLVRARARPTLGASEHLRAELSWWQATCSTRQGSRGGERPGPDELYHLAAPIVRPRIVAGPSADAGGDRRRRPPHCSRPSATTALTARVFIAASGAMFGAAPESPQREDTPCRPETPYATAKLAAHQLVGQLRAHDGIFACSGILFNHESERRPEMFVTRKITRAAAAIKLGLEQERRARRRERESATGRSPAMSCGAAWLMLQHDEPGDYVLASGIGHTVAEFAEVAFRYLGLKAVRPRSHRSRTVRPPEPTARVGDPAVPGACSAGSPR